MTQVISLAARRSAGRCCRGLHARSTLASRSVTGNASFNSIGVVTTRFPSFAARLANARVTRNFVFGKDGRFVAAPFAEFYNITNRANFGNVYGGTVGSSTFEKPTGYLGGSGATSNIPVSFQVQFGGRFSF